MADTFNHDNQSILDVEITNEMRTSYIDYAMSVIVARALPDVRDGLKPVHRRILYTMYEDGLTPDKPYRKSATTVGDVLGRYHPHGDTSAYDALVRLAQTFSLRYPLVDGHGNFGSIDGDPPAAYRYTEARLSRIATEMLTDIEKETVNFSPNFDNQRKEPDVLPARFPCLLVNGSQGIAVGMATNIPPHNLRETIDACIELLENENADLDDLMKHIQGPDFPTGGTIVGRSGIRAAYSTGRGRIHVRAKAAIEEMSAGHFRIVVTELPYMVNKARLVESIADLYREKRLEGISALRDESGRNGMKIVIELKRDANPQVVLNQLYSMTQMQSTFGIIMIALVDGQPRVLSLHDMLSEYILHRKDVVRRRTIYELRKAREREHILEGLHIAVNNIDEVIRIIRSAYDDAQQRLMDRFSLSEIQARAILEMQLRRLQGLEIEKIEEELNAIRLKIADYEDILAHDSRVVAIVRDELLDVRNRYGDDRRTEIEQVENEIDIEDLIDEQDCVYTLTNLGYIKRQTPDTYRSQRRGGRGVSAMTTREEDYAETLFIASTHDYILFFTSAGRLYRKKGYTVPESGRTAKGMNIVNLLPLEAGEKVTAMLAARDFGDDKYVVMVARSGEVKRIRLSAFTNVRQSGLRALSLEEGDELISVLLTDGSDAIIMATRQGMAICFEENDVRPTGRTAGGVRGIRLEEGDYVIGAAKAVPGAALLSVTDNGFGKRTAIEEFMRGSDEDKTPQHRGGKGLTAYRITEKTGPVAAVKVVGDGDDILLIADDGTMLRTAAADISLYSRSTQGVRVMRVQEGSRVISLARLEGNDGDDTDEISGEGGDATI